MKVKYAILTLLLVGLLGFATTAFATGADPVIALNKDIARTVAAGDSVVAVSFSVTNSHATTAFSLTKMTFGGVAAGSETLIGAGDIANLAIYEDININGVMDPGVDELVQTITASAGAILGAPTQLTLTTPIEFTAGTKRYYIVVAAVKAVGSTTTALDTKVINLSALVTDSDNDNSGTVNRTVAATFAAGACKNAATTTATYVEIVASKLQWNPAVTNYQVASGGANTVIASGADALYAVDDYDNVDTGFTETVAWAAKKYTDPSLAATAASAGAINAFGAAVAGVAQPAANLTLNGPAAEDVVIVATSGTKGLVGTTTIKIDSYSTSAPAPSTARGAEYYDYNHNGKIDAVSVFFDSPVILGATPKTAFTVQGYIIKEDPDVKVSNGGYGIFNGGEYAVTMDLVEGSTYDTNATPQITYDANTGQISSKRNSQIITVNDATGLAVGDYIVAQNGAGGIITAVAGRVITVLTPGTFSSDGGSNGIQEGRTYSAATAYITKYMQTTTTGMALNNDLTANNGATGKVVGTFGVVGANGVCEFYAVNSTSWTAAASFSIATTYTGPGVAIVKVATDSYTNVTSAGHGQVAGALFSASAAAGGQAVVISVAGVNNMIVRETGAAAIAAGDIDFAPPANVYAADDGDITVVAAVNPLLVNGSAALSISAAGITEVDKAAPVVVEAKTLDSGNGGTASNGKVDALQITLSEAVDGVSMLAGKSGGAPGTKTTSLWLESMNQKGVAEILMASGAKVTSDNKTFIFPVTEGTFLTTDAVPYIGYEQQDNDGFIIVDNATNVNGVPARNQLVVTKTNTAANQTVKITIKDAVGPIVLNVTTNDTETPLPDGHVDMFTVEFSEEVGIKANGVTFVSSVFGTYTATTAAAVTGKIINYTVTELGAAIYDTETLATFAYDPAASNTKLFDFAGNEPPLYGTGGLTQVNATRDGAKPIIVSVKTGDNYTDERLDGASQLDATGANGRLDTVVIEFSEKVTTTNYASSAVAANIDAAIGQFTYTHPLNSGGPDGAAMTTANSIFTSTGATATKPAPVWTDTPTGDTKTVITLYHEEMGHNVSVGGTMVNGGDTGMTPSLNYALSGTVANNFKDPADNTTPGTTKTATDCAAPFIVNGMTKKDGTTAKVLAAGATAAEEGSWDSAKFGNILTKDSNAATYGSDYNTGDGYIDAFVLKFSETVYTTKADSSTLASAWTVAFGTPASFSTITIDKGLDFSADGDINYNATTAVANTEDNNVGANTVTLYGTSSKMKNSWDTGQMPTLKYNGGLIIYDGCGTATQYEVGTDNVLAASIAMPSFDNAKPVPVVAVGGVKTKEIKVSWSENIFIDNAATVGTGTWTGVFPTGIYGYTDKNAAGNASLSGSASVEVTNSGSNNGSVMVIATTDTLTLADVENDSLWVAVANKVFDNADGVATNMAAGYTQNVAVDNAAGVGYKIIINDIIAPYITDAYTVDVNGNGKVDHIRFTFSEPIKLESIGGYTSLNTLSGNVAASWQFAGYTGTAQWNLFQNNDAGKAASITANEPIFTDSQINDAAKYVFYLKLQEDLVPAGVTGVGSTGYAPVMTLVAPTMSDNKPNALDINSSEVGAVKSGMIVKDNVGPVLMSAKYISGTELQATFSEDVLLSSVDKGDFTWTLSTDGTNWETKIVRITKPSAGVAVLKVTDDADWEDDMVGTLKIGNAVTDDAKTLGTGRGASYTADPANITSVGGGNDPYGATADYYKVSSGAYVPDTAKSLAPATVAIAIDWTAPVNPGGTTGPSVIAAPADLVLTDVPGDNGHWMFASFTVSADHLTYVKSYQFYRQVNFGTEEAPDLQWVYSAVVPAGYKDANGKSVCLVPVIVDGEGTWSVVASTGDIISDMALTAKEGEVPVAMLVDGAEKVAGMVLSDMSATAVGGAIDNIAPTAVEAFAVTSADDASGVVLSWTAPADNGIVGYYGNGVVNNIPIYGVESYEVYRKTGSAEFALVGTAAAGSSSYTDAMSPASTVYTYYVKSVDSNPEHLVVSSNRSGIAASPLQGDFTGDSIVNASDFSIFAAAYGKKAVDNEEAYVWSYDLTNDGIINASDFSVFAAKYGSTLPTAKAAIAEMPTSDLPFTFSANVDDATSTYFLNVNIGKSDALKGFEFFLSYDKENFEFLPNSVNGLVGLNMTAEVEDGIIRVTDWFVGEEFDGTVSFGFKTSGLNRTSTFEILNAMVDDVNGLAAATNFSEFEARALPTVYTLSQNYPNPFNPTTTIDYAMPKSGNVELVIFNTSGQKVRTLVSNVQDAGFYKVVWDGRNDLGEQVASGVYIYKLAADSFSKTAKMNLVK